MKRQLSVCFFGFDEKEEGGRAWAVRTGLAEHGITVKPCRTLVGGFFAKYRDLYRKWKMVPGTVDAFYIIFMGSYLMPLAWYLARRQGIPILLDMLVSQYDTEVVDRKRVSRASPRAWFLWAVDYMSCHIADAIVVDTLEHKKFFVEKFFVNEKKVVVVPVGCRSDLFVPLPSTKGAEDDVVVEFHGSFIPLQGIEYIIEAAKILQDKHERVRFEIVGSGQLFVAMTRRAEELRLTNMAFFGREPLAELPHSIARGDICLGIFGATAKALRVIPNKVYECLSCGKPVITERSPAALEALHDYEDVCMVEPGNGRALAEKIIELARDAALRERLSMRAREISHTAFSPRAIVNPLVDWLESRP
ncbi:MAG: Glycosyl transferase group 1 [Parcubacteria group bacterium GW2011_GWA2_56_21]|nr:MAG: Glycosyl transferase group 1 [Parcubacteria group bacterium GW2011_GWA2_56_21]